MNSARASLELVRLPNAFTAVADIAAGFWLATGRFQWTLPATALALASGTLYSAGIVFNDLRDIETDRRERPGRPLPSGRITRTDAIRLAIGLSILGVALAFAAGFLGTNGEAANPGPSRRFLPGLVGLGLLIAILLYDFAFKGTMLGPLSMGLCRGLNLLMAMSVAWWFDDGRPGLVVIAMTCYIASVTYFGRDEAGGGTTFRLATGGCFVLGSVLILGVAIVPELAADFFVSLLWAVMLVHFGRMVYRTVTKPSPQQVQRAMKALILGLIVFDATVAAAAVGWLGGVCILILLIPALLLGRWVYST